MRHMRVRVAGLVRFPESNMKQTEHRHADMVVVKSFDEKVYCEQTEKEEENRNGRLNEGLSLLFII